MLSNIFSSTRDDASTESNQCKTEPVSLESKLQNLILRLNSIEIELTNEELTEIESQINIIKRRLFLIAKSSQPESSSSVSSSLSDSNTLGLDNKALTTSIFNSIPMLADSDLSTSSKRQFIESLSNYCKLVHLPSNLIGHIILTKLSADLQRRFKAHFPDSNQCTLESFSAWLVTKSDLERDSLVARVELSTTKQGNTKVSKYFDLMLGIASRVQDITEKELQRFIIMGLNDSLRVHCGNSVDSMIAIMGEKFQLADFRQVLIVNEDRVGESTVSSKINVRVSKIGTNNQAGSKSWANVDWKAIQFIDSIRGVDTLPSELSEAEKQACYKSGICYVCRQTTHVPDCRKINVALKRFKAYADHSSFDSRPVPNTQNAPDSLVGSGKNESTVDGSTPPTNIDGLVNVNSPKHGIDFINTPCSESEIVCISTVSTRSSQVPLVTGLDSTLDGSYWSTTKQGDQIGSIDSKPTETSASHQSAIDSSSDTIDILRSLTKLPEVLHVPNDPIQLDPIEIIRSLSKHEPVPILPEPVSTTSPASNTQIASSPQVDAPGINKNAVDGSTPPSLDDDLTSLNSPSQGIKTTLESGEASENLDYTCTMPATSSKRFIVNVFTNGVAARGLLDSGSLAMVMKPSFAQELGLTPHNGPDLNLVFADGRSTLANQYCTASVTCGNYKRQWEFVLLDIEEDIIIGTPFFSSITVLHLDIDTQNFQFRTRKNPQRLVKWFGESHHRFSSNIPIRICSINELNNKDEISEIRIYSLSDNQIHEDYQDLVDNSHPLIAEVIKKFPDRFPQKPTPAHDLPKRPEDMKINLIPGATIPRSKLIRRSEKEKLAIKEFVRESLENGRLKAQPEHCKDSIEPANALLIRKQDGSLRVVIDWRFLNSVTVKDKTPLPPYQEIWENVRGKPILGKMDIRDAFYNILIDEDSQHFTSFRTTDGLFYFTVCPMGLTNSPATFMRLMNRIFPDMNDVFLNYYMDDLLIYSDTIEEHAKHVERILQRLREHSLVLKPTKCLFAVNELDFCGMRISAEGIDIQQTQREVMCEYPQISSRKQLQSFLGSVRFLADFIPGLADIAFDLFELTSKNSSWSWNIANQTSVRILQFHMVNSPCLRYFDSSLETFVHSDASDFAIGGWVGQMHMVDGKLVEFPVCYWSRKLTPAERKTPTHDKELLAMFSMIVKFRMYLFGVSFTVLVDHRSLENLQTQQFLNPKQIRIVEYLQAFDFTVKYINGPSNVFADWLSRNYDLKSESCPHCHLSLDVAPVSEISISAISSAIDLNSHVESIKLQQEKDSFCIELQHWLEKPKEIPRSKVGYSKSFTRVNDMWYYKNRALVIPMGEFRLKYLQLFHDSIQHGHFGFLKTKELMSRRVYWDSMDKDLHSFIQSCDLCQRSKACKAGSAGLLHPLPIADSRGVSVSMDFAAMPKSEDGNDYLMVIVDRFSKLTVAVPTTTKLTAEICADLFWKNWVLRGYGIPQSIVSDRDSLFVGKFWKRFCKICGIDQLMSTARHQQTDGLSELEIRMIKESLRRVCNFNQNNWDALLEDVLFSYNNSINSSTGFTPFFLMHAFEPITLPTFLDRGSQKLSTVFQRHSDAIDQTHLALSEAQSRQSNSYNTRHHDNFSYKVGDWVLLDRSGIQLAAAQTISQKLLNPWIGPFEVLEYDSEKDNVTLKLPLSMKVHNVFHVRCLRKYIPPNTNFPTRFTSSRSDTVINDNGEEWEVERILATRIYRKQRQFLVRWTNFYSIEDTWEPVENLENCQESLQEFIKKCEERDKLLDELKV